MHPIIATFGVFNIYSWGLMVALGSLVGLTSFLYYAKIEKVPSEMILDLFVYVVIASVVGARLFYIIGNPAEYIKNPLSVFFVQEGGMAFIGGFVFVSLVVYIYVKAHKLNILKILDILSPGTMLGYAIGRIGCFLNGCCYGINLFGFVQPTQLYSSFAGLLMFILLARFYPNKKYDGQVFLVTMLMYSFYRFFIEFLRFSPMHILMLTPNQYLALVMAIFAAGGLWKKNSTL